MQTAPDIDLVILGAGCAGLSLAARLARSSSTLRIVVVEPRTVYVDDRSWCFWGSDCHDLSDLVSRTWPSWIFSGPNDGPHRHQVPGLSYQYIRGIDFYQRALSDIASARNITLQLGTRAIALKREANGVRIDTDRGVLHAAHVVDTRPCSGAAMLYQSFVGFELESEHAVPFTADEVTLMGSMAADAQGLRFVYSLPLSSHRVIVEWTRFNEAPVDRSVLTEELRQLLDRLGLAGARIVRSEGGALAMGLGPDARPPLTGVVRAGTGGGALRAASGYGFLRIQRWAEACTDQLLAGKAPVGHPREPWLRRSLDRVFLQAIRERPERTAEYFLSLARRVPPAVLVRFLSDGARPLDYLRIILSLPVPPFLRQAGRRAVFTPAFPLSLGSTVDPAVDQAAS